MKAIFTKHAKLILTAVAIVIVVVLCAVFKYKALMPVMVLAVLTAAIVLNRKILQRNKKKDTQEVVQCTLTGNETNRLAQYFVSRDERYISSLGNGYIMNYLANGSLGRGFAVISNKRVYFRGSCLSGQGSNLIKTNEERTVDIKDVTGSGFIYRRYIGVLLGLFAALAALIGGAAFSLTSLFNAWEDTKSYQEKADWCQDRIDEIDKSDERIDDLIDQIAANQESVEELQRELSDLNALQLQEILEVSKESISIGDFLYDTEINEAFEEYLYEMETIFEQSILYYLLNRVADFAYDVRYDRYGSYDETTKRRVDIILDDEGLANLYNYDINGDILVDYYTRFSTCEVDLVSFCNNIIGITNDAMQRVCDGGRISGWYVFADDSWNSYDHISVYDLLSTEKIELSLEAYRNFLEKVGVTDPDGGVPTLPEICLNYVIAHPDASFANYVELSGITTKYDAQIDELSARIADLSSANTELEIEIVNIENERGERANYENQYRTAKGRASFSFSVVSVAAAAAGLLSTFLVSCVLVFLNYLRRRKTMFQIQYAGGCIAFNVSYYAKAEIDDFQKQLRRAKDFAEESVSQIPAAESSVPSAVQSNVSDDLRKYADLLKEGLISQEEYDAMKKKILGL